MSPALRCDTTLKHLVEKKRKEWNVMQDHVHGKRLLVFIQIFMHCFLRTHLSPRVLKCISLHFYAVPVWFIGVSFTHAVREGKSQQSKLKSDGFSAFILCKYPFPSLPFDAPLLEPTCLFFFPLSSEALGRSGSKTFCLVLIYFFSSFLSFCSSQLRVITTS